MPVIGLGGFFFRAQDPEGLTAWYRETLGVGIGQRREAHDVDEVLGVVPERLAPRPRHATVVGWQPHREAQVLVDERALGG